MKLTSSLAVRPARRDVRHSWRSRHRTTFQVLALLVLGGVLAGGSYWAFPRTNDETFLREAVVAALGAVVTVVTAAAVAAVSLAGQIRARRQSVVLHRQDDATWHRSSVQVGRMRIPDIVVVASCDQGREWTDRVDLEFSEMAATRPASRELTRLREERLPPLRERAGARGVTFVDEPCVDLVAASVELRKGEDGRRRPVYSLTPAVATYYDFAVTSNGLDQPWSAAGEDTTLRRLWDVRPQSIEAVSDLPAMAKIGVGTAVVTKDGRLVLGVRGKTFIAGQDGDDARAAVHVVAEGMTPGDLDRRGRIDPVATARRGLLEELNIGAAERAHGRIEDLRATGFFFDQQRWQPCFAYLARIDLTWDELQTAAPAASGYWEVERLVSLPFTVRDAGMRYLLMGTHPDLTLASNHAAAVLWFALLHQHGLYEMRDELTQIGAVHLAPQPALPRAPSPQTTREAVAGTLA